jgi:hypothetical protein
MATLNKFFPVFDTTFIQIIKMKINFTLMATTQLVLF